MATILHVTSGLALGGAETMLAQLATGLCERGHVQHVVSLRGRGAVAGVLEQRGLPVTALMLDSAAGGVRGALHLRRLIARLKPDVIQGWMYHGNLAATFGHLSSGRRSARRLFWSLRASNMDAARYGRVIRWNAWWSRTADVVIANSAAGVTFHVAQGLRARRFEVVPNGIDTARFQPDAAARASVRAAEGIPPDAVLAIHVARVDPMKDHAMFLTAMRAVPDLQAIVVGLGTDRLTLPPNVRSLGMRTDVERLYPAADVVVSSSAFGEGFSNALAEGMSAGLIPIATDVGDARAIVGETGAVVPASDVEALVAKLREAATLSPEERLSRGRSARARIVEHFSLAKAVDAFERLYTSEPAGGT